MLNEDIKKQITVMIYKSFFDYRDKVNDEDLKNYFLGFVFYKYISNKMERFADFELHIGNKKYNQIDENSEEGKATLAAIKKSSIKKLGYFISPSDLINQVCQFNDDDIIVRKVIFDLQNAFMRIGLSTVGQESEEAFTGIFSDILSQNEKMRGQENDANMLIRRILYQICAIDFSSEADVMGEVFENLIEQFNEVISRSKSGGIQVPPKIRSLLTKIVSTGKSQIENVYDPTCGTGSLLLSMLKETNLIKGIYGQEINPTTYNLCRMNMMMHDIPFNKFDIKLGHTLEEPKHIGQHFESIVSIPPFSSQWRPNSLLNFFESDARFASYGILAPSKSADFAFVQHMLYHLGENGTMACILRMGALFSGGPEGRIRKYLIVEHNVIDAVIGLPANIFNHTKIPTCILVLKKNRKFNDKILFIDASRNFNKSKSQNTLSVLGVEKIINAYRHRSIEKDYSQLVSIDEIKKNEFNLDTPKYVDSFSRKLFEKEKMGELVKLGDLVELVPGLKYDINETKIFKIKYLSNINSESDVTIEKLEAQETILNKKNYKKMDLMDGDIIVKTIWGNLQPTRFRGVGPTSVMVNHLNLTVLRPKHKIDSEYLFFQLQTENVLNQIRINSKVWQHRRITTKDLLSLQVLQLTDKEKHEFFDNEAHEIISKLNTRELSNKKEQALKEELKEDEFQFIRFLCHDLKPHLSKIKTNIKLVNTFMANIDLLKNSHAEPLDESDCPMSNGALFEEALSTTEHIISLLDKVRQLVIAESDKEKVDLIGLFKTSFKQHLSTKVKMLLSQQPQNTKIELLISKTLFIEAFNNIFRNAILHGLADKETTLNLYININNEHPNILTIEYMNDGKKFPENMNETDFLSFGRKGKNSSGDGLGGAFIKKILKLHNATFEIKRDTSYGVHFVFNFPKGETYE